MTLHGQSTDFRRISVPLSRAASDSLKKNLHQHRQERLDLWIHCKPDFAHDPTNVRPGFSNKSKQTGACLVFKCALCNTAT